MTKEEMAVVQLLGDAKVRLDGEIGSELGMTPEILHPIIHELLKRGFISGNVPHGPFHGTLEGLDELRAQQGHLAYKTLRAIQLYLKAEFPKAIVTRESPRTMTSEIFIVDAPPESMVVGFTDTLLASVLNSGGFLDEENVAAIFERGDVLQKMRDARGATVIVTSLSGDTLPA